MMIYESHVKLLGKQPETEEQLRPYSSCEKVICCADKNDTKGKNKLSDISKSCFCNIKK